VIRTRKLSMQVRIKSHGLKKYLASYLIKLPQLHRIFFPNILPVFFPQTVNEWEESNRDTYLCTSETVSDNHKYHNWCCLIGSAKSSMHPPVLINTLQKLVVGWDSAVSIETRYGLDGSGIESRWGSDFLHPFRSALGSTQPPIQWIPGLSRV
jgi:hypothetical protein